MSDNFGTFGIPNADLPVGSVPGRDGTPVPVKFHNAWYRFLTRLSQLNAEKPIVDVSVGPSPFSFVADTIGHLSISGGTISARTLTRGSKTISVGTTPMVPVAAGDVVTVTYSVLPTLSFVPGARA